jgi:sec-independent protein translocase protein TatC
MKILPQQPPTIIDPDDMFSDTRMSMGDHIEELRKHLLRAIYGFALCMLFSFFIGHWVMTKIIAAPVEEQLLVYWQRYNDKQLEPIVAKMKSGELKLPRFPVDLNKWAGQYEFRDSTGKKLDIKLHPVGAPLFDPAPLFLGHLLKYGLEAPADARKRGDWMYLEPEPVEYVKSTQDLSLAIKPPTLRSMALQESFVVFIMVCMLTGFVIASPWVFYQIWTFIAAGLYPHEKRLVNVYLPYSVGLFLGGVFLCQFVVMPRAIAGLLWFNEWLGLEPDLRLNEWLGFAILMPLIFGISFQTPLVMLFAYTIGAIEIQGFRKFRSYAYFVIAALAAIFLPAPDLMSIAMLVGPMCLLYELGIFLCIMQPRIEYEDADSESHELIEV